MPLIRTTLFRKWNAWKIAGSLLFVAGLATTPAAAQQASERSEFWPELDTTKFLVLESYYTRQHDTRSAPEYINALGITLQLHLR